MEIWVNSATKTEDYTWRTCAGHEVIVPPLSITAGYDKWKFEDENPWFGLVSLQDTAILFFGNLMTSREDTRGRPIAVHAALQAMNATEAQALCDITSSLLLREKELLPEWTSFFLNVFDTGERGEFPAFSQSVGTGSPQEAIGRFVYPREDAPSRESIATRLVSGIDPSMPLAVGTTGRSGKGIFERVCNSEGKWQVALFSSKCTEKSELLPLDEKGGPKKKSGGRRRGIPIGWRGRRVLAVSGFFLLVLGLAWLGELVRPGGQGLGNGEDVSAQDPNPVDQDDGPGKGPVAEITGQEADSTHPLPSAGVTNAPVLPGSESSETLETTSQGNDAVKVERPSAEVSSPVMAEDPDSTESVPSDATGTTIDQQTGGTAPIPGDAPDVSGEDQPRLPEPGAAETPAGTECPKQSLPSHGFASEPVAPAPESSAAGATAVQGNDAVKADSPTEVPPSPVVSEKTDAAESGSVDPEVVQSELSPESSTGSPAATGTPF